MSRTETATTTTTATLTPEENIQEGVRLYQACKYQKALGYFKAAEEANHPCAYLYLLFIYRFYIKDKDQEVYYQQKTTEQVRWFQEQAETGAETETNVAFAQYNLGCLYHYGQGVKQNHQEAARLYELAAKQGLAAAQYNLGYLYDKGLGVDQNHEKAAELYRLAAEQGLAAAQYGLGYLYRYGLGVDQNHEKAAELYRLAAEQGLAAAQYGLGCLYHYGPGVEKNPITAFQYYREAAQNGLTEAQYALTWWGWDFLRTVFNSAVDQNDADTLRCLFQKYSHTNFDTKDALALTKHKSYTEIQNYLAEVRLEQHIVDMKSAGFGFFTASRAQEQEAAKAFLQYYKDHDANHLLGHEALLLKEPLFQYVCDFSEQHNKVINQLSELSVGQENFSLLLLKFTEYLALPEAPAKIPKEIKRALTQLEQILQPAQATEDGITLGAMHYDPQTLFRLVSTSSQFSALVIPLLLKLHAEELGDVVSECINARDSDGFTVLMRLAQLSNVSWINQDLLAGLIETVLLHGADPSLREGYLLTQRAFHFEASDGPLHQKAKLVRDVIAELSSIFSQIKESELVDTLKQETDVTDAMLIQTLSEGRLFIEDYNKVFVREFTVFFGMSSQALEKLKESLTGFSEKHKEEIETPSSSAQETSFFRFG